jgi:anaerobic selenocysteine-containing dehydrogenase
MCRSDLTNRVNPGEVWEEDEFWIELSWRIDPDGSLGVRPHFESPYRAGAKLTIDESYPWIFDHSVPGLPEAAAQGLTPLAYRRQYGAFAITYAVYTLHDTPLDPAQLAGAAIDPATHLVRQQGQVIGVEIDSTVVTGFATPSRQLALCSQTLPDWHWPEHVLPGYIKSHVHREHIDQSRGAYVLLPTFRLPTLIHTRAGNAKWLYESAHTTPLWLHPRDAERLGVGLGSLVKGQTAAGSFVRRVWMPEARRPGVVACSHHLGRWRLARELGGDRWSTALADVQEGGPGQWR